MTVDECWNKWKASAAVATKAVADFASALEAQDKAKKVADDTGKTADADRKALIEAVNNV